MTEHGITRERLAEIEHEIAEAHGCLLSSSQDMAAALRRVWNLVENRDNCGLHIGPMILIEALEGKA